MNAHQRKKLGTARHYRMPLGCDVKVTARGGVVYFGTMGKHDRSQCIVHFTEHNSLSRAANPVATQPFAWVTYHNVRPLKVNRVRPWWRVLHERNGVTKCGAATRYARESQKAAR